MTRKMNWRKHIEEIKDALVDRILSEKLETAYAAFQTNGDEQEINAAIRDALSDYDARMTPQG